MTRIADCCRRSILPEGTFAGAHAPAFFSCHPLPTRAASASYIVAPAVLQYAIPEANPALYFGLSLGITFPLNILVGIPAYTAMAQALLG